MKVNKFQCTVVISGLSPVLTGDSVTLSVSGKRYELLYNGVYRFTVPQASLDISESTKGSASGLTHTLTCKATLANRVLPSLVTLS